MPERALTGQLSPRAPQASTLVEGATTRPAGAAGPTDRGTVGIEARSRAARAGLAASGVGALAGAIAAVADVDAAWASGALSVSGPWIALATGVAWATHRVVPRSALLPAATTSLFLVASVAAYYAGKDLLLASVPVPTAWAWAAVGLSVGSVGGAAIGLALRLPFGGMLVVGAVTGWLAAEAWTSPAARVPEAGLVALLAAPVGLGLARSRRLASAAPWMLGVVGGALAQVLFIGAFRLLVGHLG